MASLLITALPGDCGLGCRGETIPEKLCLLAGTAISSCQGASLDVWPALGANHLGRTDQHGIGQRVDVATHGPHPGAGDIFTL